MDAPEAVREHWSDLLEDMETAADGFRTEGWAVLELHPGDVTVDDDAVALGVLVSDNEFERFEAMVAAGGFDEHDVYRTAAGAVFLGGPRRRARAGGLLSGVLRPRRRGTAPAPGPRGGPHPHPGGAAVG